MVNPNRRFFVGGNFKMNGTVDMITNLIEHLNNAHLDGKTGACCFPPS
jgi:triosephosphate isomerase